MVWLRRDTWLRRSVILLLLCLLGWALVAHTTFMFAPTLDGSPTSLGVIHAWCSANDPAIWGPNSVSACSQQNTWWAVQSWLEVIGLVAFLVVGFRVYQINFGRRRTAREY